MCLRVWLLLDGRKFVVHALLVVLVRCCVGVVLGVGVSLFVWRVANGLPHKWGQKSKELLQDPLSTVYPSKRRG